MKMKLAVWVVLAMIGAGLALLFAFADTEQNFRTIGSDEAVKLIEASNNALYSISEFKDGHKDLRILLAGESGRSIFHMAPTGPVLAALTARNITPEVCVEGKDFHKWGYFGRVILPLFLIGILVGGAVTLIRLPKQNI